MRASFAALIARAIPKSLTTGCLDQDVFGLDVAMHDVLRMRVGQRVRDVARCHRVGDRRSPYARAGGAAFTLDIV